MSCALSNFLHAGNGQFRTASPLLVFYTKMWGVYFYFYVSDEDIVWREALSPSFRINFINIIYYTTSWTIHAKIEYFITSSHFWRYTANIPCLSRSQPWPCYRPHPKYHCGGNEPFCFQTESHLFIFHQLHMFCLTSQYLCENLPSKVFNILMPYICGLPYSVEVLAIPPPSAYSRSSSGMWWRGEGKIYVIITIFF